jgi:hypothetical protein
MKGEGYIQPTLATLGTLLALGGLAACGHNKSTGFQGCKAASYPNKQKIVDSTGAWAERLADSIAACIENEKQGQNLRIRTTLTPNDHELVKVSKQVKSSVSSRSSNRPAGTGEYVLTEESTTWPRSQETIDAVEIRVNGGVKQFDPVYLLAIFREHGRWSFDQEIVCPNGMLTSVDVGMLNSKAFRSEIADFAEQVIIHEQQGDPVRLIHDPSCGTK